MGKAGHAIVGTLLGSGAVVGLSYVWAELNRPLPADNGAYGVFLFGACWFTFIGAILGALGGLWVERWNRERREPNEPPK